MKNLKIKSPIVLIALIAIIVTSCENFSLTGIKGSGSVVSENIDANLIEGLNLEIPATVYLTKSNDQSIRIDAQQNILDNIETYVTDDVLTIKFDENVANHKDIKIYISLANLKRLSITGSGDISSDDSFETEEKLDISISGSGDIEADAPEVEINISGSGDIKLVTNTQKLNSNISGSGDILLSGESTGTANYQISGSGDISAFDFETVDCSVNTAGSGSAKVYVTNSLNVVIAGTGDVYYKGNPSLNVSIAGTGNVVNAN